MIPARYHVLKRTSPKGEPFVGTCVMCGADGLTVKDADVECPNPLGRTFEEAWNDATTQRLN